jgi:hypothetical protein
MQQVQCLSLPLEQNVLSSGVLLPPQKGLLVDGVPIEVTVLSQQREIDLPRS